MKRHIVTLITVTIALGTLAQRSHNFDMAKNMEIFTTVYRNLDMMYVDTLDPSQVMTAGINAMMRALDPYTEYYPEERTKELKMMLTGKYAGIGSIVRYHRRLHRVVIDEPYEGMPAAEAGLRKGDIIISIDDSTMTDKDVSYVSEHLRGDPGTTFILEYERPATGERKRVPITRRSIKLPAIPYYGIIDNGIGYINLGDFTEGSAGEMLKVFTALKSDGAKSLILDLRSNGGGSLQEAVDILNMWIPEGVTLVETRGKLTRANRTYRTRTAPVDTVMPIVVLVNGETASAAEITSGSLQDLDRGVVVGTRTYGKGLVQVPLELPYNANMKVTTSKYYIPSGRCIQAINYKRSTAGGGYTERIPDSLTHVFHTRAGREVRDGGGISPDVTIASDTLPNIAIYLDRVDTAEVMFDFVTNYIATHYNIVPPKDFSLTDAEWEAFKAQVIESGFTYDNISLKRFDDLVRVAKAEGYYDDAVELFDSLKAALTHDVARDLDRHREVIQEIIEHDIITHYYYQGGGIAASFRYDTQFAEALRLLNTGDYNTYLTIKDVKRWQ